MFRKVAFQVLVLGIVSILAGFWASAIGVNFFVGSITGLVLQYAAYSSFTTIFNAVILLKNKKLENERLKEFSYQGLELECPCYKKTKELVPVRFNTSNYYRCRECNKQLSVIISADTAVVTEPILNTDLPNLKLNEVDKLSNANT